jgi:glycine/D-amino acid oxidase-like deaminating enzyme
MIELGPVRVFGMADSIVIIGAGIAGASVAYHLGTRADASVTVVERGAVGAETTGKSTAVFRLMDDPVLSSMKRDGMALYNELSRSPSARPAFVRTGRLEVATTADAGAPLAERAAALENASYHDGDRLCRTVYFPELDGEVVAGALFSPNAGYFRPAELAHELLARAREAGVSVETGTEVTDVEKSDGTVTGVRTDERLPADHVVSAVGPWNPAVARLAGVEPPIKHTLAPILKLQPEGFRPHVLPNVKHVESGYYAVGRRDGSVLVGHTPGSYDAAGTEYDPDAVSDEVPPDIVDGALDAIGELFPSLADAPVVEEWVGIRSLTPDGRPIVGPTAVDGFSIAAFNSEGIQLAPAAGRALAASIAGNDRPEYADAIHPSRFPTSGRPRE